MLKWGLGVNMRTKGVTTLVIISNTPHETNPQTPDPFIFCAHTN
jgi:hypothetical protein